MPYVAAPSIPPIAVNSSPVLHQGRIVIMDLAAPAAKCAASEMIVAVIKAGTPAIKKNGIIGTNAPRAVASVPEITETHGTLRSSSVVFNLARASALIKMLLVLGK